MKKFLAVLLMLAMLLCGAAFAEDTAPALTKDTIEIKENAKSSQRYKDILEVTAGRLVPEWLDVDQENLKGEVKELPTREMIDVPVDEMLIVELYSK